MATREARTSDLPYLPEVAPAPGHLLLLAHAVVRDYGFEKPPALQPDTRPETPLLEQVEHRIELLLHERGRNGGSLRCVTRAVQK